ncbi:MAG: hypothetical protein MZV64_62410 [Ignavibacteriales bacterium]|nr:hypothetical protein [Ignavibacteriales bacterium]
MIRFRPWLWFVDFLSVALIRFCWQVAPGAHHQSLLRHADRRSAADLWHLGDRRLPRRHLARTRRWPVTAFTTPMCRSLPR